MKNWVAEGIASYVNDFSVQAIVRGFEWLEIWGFSWLSYWSYSALGKDDTIVIILVSFYHHSNLSEQE